MFISNYTFRYCSWKDEKYLSKIIIEGDLIEKDSFHVTKCLNRLTKASFRKLMGQLYGILEQNISWPFHTTNNW